jgi:hypothetical protein
MNQRIKDIAEHANIHFSRIGLLDGDPNGSARMVGYSKMEKFAELIVKECAKVSENYAAGSMPLSIALAIKEHFGVE